MIAYLCDRTLVKVVANILFVNLVKHLESINPERLVYWLKKILVVFYFCLHSLLPSFMYSSSRC